MKRTALPLIALALAAGCVGTQACAATIVLTNDDGLTSNVRALYSALKEVGHDVIVAVPCTNQSGMGAAIHVHGVPPRLEENCRNGAAKAGDPSAGPMTKAGVDRDWFYVSGTPVMALMFGLDVAARQRWNAAPDLVISGPNEGQNAGPIVISSGTIGNAQFALLKGIPAIAVSAGTATAGDGDLANPASSAVAGHTVRLVERLVAAAGSSPLLPHGIALNVNFPDRLDDLRWKQARIGTYSSFIGAYRAGTADAPAQLVFGSNPVPPTPDQQDDEAAVVREAAAISVMKAGFEGSQDDARVARVIGSLVTD